MAEGQESDFLHTTNQHGGRSSYSRLGAPSDAVHLPSGSTVTATVVLNAANERERLLEDPALRLSEESHLLNIGGMGQVALVAAPAPLHDDDLLHKAEEVARSAQTAVVVGLTEEQESEAADKETLSLPGRQDELVHRVAAAAARTVEVANAATPILMPWLQEVDAVVIAGLPGQEGGNAIAAVLIGERELTGRLVTSYPSADGAAPVWEVLPGAVLRSAERQELVPRRQGQGLGGQGDPFAQVHR
ncbi:glycoside hydrolase family 3 protein [Arthrobacter sp. H-02-3]|uniref:glycoside hydrolase family 3 protein n=1 Tax=Arthrobacter sp. H-02-3 TaxID=2703675 RepID=UPI000DD1933B|nr:glycoside hydrolase family 3 C-terminal domain-containing protein [Arthrobacter sp. H-02-3]PVZ55237.1 hypothetical protein C9424_14145 [Arthrobacter sp. H-02-3]